jgi:Leucine-rich repeat (LRR) protein
VYSLDLSQQELEFAIEDDMKLFSHLHTLNASENLLPFARLGTLPSLLNLNFSCNGLKSLDLDVMGKFQNLERLELQSNNVDRAALIVLSTLPKLKFLDLTRNGLKILYNDFHNLMGWQEKVIELLLPLEVAALQLDSPDGPIALEDAAKDCSIVNQNCDTSVVSQRSNAIPSGERSLRVLGFAQLETLVLDFNPLGMASPITFWNSLAPLPK